VQKRKEQRELLRDAVTSINFELLVKKDSQTVLHLSPGNQITI